MGRLDINANALRLTREIANGQRMPGRRNISLVHRLVRLGLDGDLDAWFIGQHIINRLDDSFDSNLAILGLANIRPFARKPENNQLCLQRIDNIQHPSAPLFGVLPTCRIIRGVRTVDGTGVLPYPGRDEFGD